MWTAENTYQMIKQILYNCEADCTVLIWKPQVISGGVRTPCTLPLDPPLFLQNKNWLRVQDFGNICKQGKRFLMLKCGRAPVVIIVACF